MKQNFIVNVDTKNRNVLWTISSVRLLQGETEDFLKNSIVSLNINSLNTIVNIEMTFGN